MSARTDQSVLPYAGVLLAVRRGNLSSRHIPNVFTVWRQFVLTAVSVAVGVTLLVLLGAPRDLVALVGAMLAKPWTAEQGSYS